MASVSSPEETSVSSPKEALISIECLRHEKKKHTVHIIPQAVFYEFAPAKFTCHAGAPFDHKCTGDGCVYCKDVHVGEVREMTKDGSEFGYRSVRLASPPYATDMKGRPMGTAVWGKDYQGFDIVNMKEYGSRPVIFWKAFEKNTCCLGKLVEIIRQYLDAKSTSAEATK